MLPRVCTPAQAPEVEVLRVAVEVPQLHEEAVGHVPQPKGSDVLTPALRAAGYARCIRRRILPFRATRVKISCSSLRTQLVERLERRTDLESLF